MFSFIETRLFSQLVGEYLSDDEYVSLKLTLVANPQAGTLIAKNVAESIPAHLLRRIKEEIDG